MQKINYLMKHRNFKNSSLADKFQMLLLTYFSKKYLNVSSCFYTLLGCRVLLRGASPSQHPCQTVLLIRRTGTLTILFLFVTSIFALNREQSYYSVQLASSQFLTEGLQEGFNKVSNEEFARIEKRGDWYVLRVGFWEDRSLAERCLERLSSEFEGAYVRKAKYTPENLIKYNWQIEESLDEKYIPTKQLEPKLISGIFEIDGNEIIVKPNDEIKISKKSNLKIKEIKTEPILKNVKANFVGFARDKNNTGQDIGFLIRYEDLLKNKSVDKEGNKYKIEVKADNKLLGNFYVIFQEAEESAEKGEERFYKILKEDKVVSTEEEIKEVKGYIVGPKDVLTINVWGEENLSGDFTVDERGIINLPLIGEIKVTMTIPEIKEVLTSKLRQYIVSPIVNVSIKEYNSKKVKVLGEVSGGRTGIKGGIYTLKGPTKISECITYFGGFTEFANIEDIKILREDGTIKTVNFNKILFENLTTEDIELNNGDIVYVPSLKQIPQKKILVLGEVKSPGVYFFEKGPFVTEAIAKAGGFTEDAILSDIKIIRGNLEKPTVLSFNLSKLLKGKEKKEILLEENDIIYIPKSFIGNINHVLKQILPTVQFLGWTYTLTD